MGKRSATQQSRGTGSRTPLIVGILVVGVLAIVIGSTLFGHDDADASGGTSTVGPIPITRAAVQFPTSVDRGVVVAGAPAPTGKAAKARGRTPSTCTRTPSAPPVRRSSPAAARGWPGP